MVEELWWFVSFTVATTVELAPWFLAAVVLAVLVQHLDLDLLATRAFTRHGVLGVVLSAAVGALSPFCSFTVIPLVTRLLRSGVPLSVIMAFWIASPAMDPEIFALSAAALGTDVAVARLAGAIVLSVGAGMLALLVERRGGFREVLRPAAAGTSSKETARTPVPAYGGAVATAGAPAAVPGPPSAEDGARRSASAPEPSPWADDDGRAWHRVVRDHARAIGWRRFVRDVLRDLRVLGGWLVLAIVAQGVIVRYVPPEWVTAGLGTGDWWAVPLAGAVGVPLYLNGVGAIPVTEGLLAQGMMPGAAVTFLIAGAITTVPAMVAVRAVARRGTFAFYLGVGFVGSVLVGAVSQLWL
jgi:uncharacterized protein